MHLPFIGHTLQVSIEGGLQVPSIARVLGRCKKLAQQFHKSTQLKYSLREKHRLLSEGQSMELIKSCPTRWGFTYLMLEQIQTLRSSHMCAVLLDQPFNVRYLLPDGEGGPSLRSSLQYSHECIVLSNLKLAQFSTVQTSWEGTGSDEKVRVQGALRQLSCYFLHMIIMITME